MAAARNPAAYDDNLESDQLLATSCRISDAREVVNMPEDGALQPVRERLVQMWRLRATALFVACLVAAAAVAWLSFVHPKLHTVFGAKDSVVSEASTREETLGHLQGRRESLRARNKPHEEQGAKAECGTIVRDVDFWTRHSLYVIIPIHSAEQCRSRCSYDPHCRVWTWGKRLGAGKGGLMDVCYLKKLGEDEKPQRHVNSGVSSGVVCEAEVSPPQESTVVTTTTTLQPGQEDDYSDDMTLDIRHTRAHCGSIEDSIDYWTETSLYKLIPILSAEECRAKCEASRGCHVWTWGKRRDMLGLTDVCFLKRLAKGEQARKHVNYGVTSGLVCRSENELEEPDQRHCDPVEAGVDFMTPKPLYIVTPILSEESCRTMCQQEQECGAWTFGKAQEVEGLTDVCFLKAFGDDSKIHRRSKEGVVSGAACKLPEGADPEHAEEEKKKDEGDEEEDEVDHDHRRSTTTATTTEQVRKHSTTTTAVDLDIHRANMKVAPDSLFCFALMLPHGYERELLAAQYKEGTNLFGCDDYAVYSSKVIKITEGLETAVVDSNLKCGYGGEFGTALNTDIFMIVWVKVLSDGQYLHAGWTVKVDPDTVFFPSRLRAIVVQHEEQPNGVYLNNCKFGLHGPLEIFSRNAVQAWANGSAGCVKHFTRLCSGPCLWGEDMFIDQCLSRVLHVKRVNEWNLLQEAHCDPPKGWESCQDETKISFHPFKTIDGYKGCWNNATNAEG